jgi:hypothetical protein
VVVVVVVGGDIIYPDLFPLGEMEATTTKLSLYNYCQFSIASRRI